MSSRATTPAKTATKAAAASNGTGKAVPTGAVKPVPTGAAKATGAAKTAAAATGATGAKGPAAKAAPPAHAVPKADNIAEGAAAAAAHDAPEKEKKTRQQLTQILDLHISQARCATHLKQYLGDEHIETQIKELRAELKTAKEAKDAAREKDLKTQIADLSKTLVRLSSETPIASAVVMDNMVKELLRRGMEQAIAVERKIVEVAHLHEGTPATMVYYPIFCKLPTFVHYNPEQEEELRKQRAATNKAAKEAREAKKAASEDKKGLKGKGAKAAPKTPVEDDGEADGEDHAEHTKTTFFTYVENALKNVKKDEAFRTMRVSNRVREYLSDLVAEGIARLASLARLMVQIVVGVRTMNADHVKAVVHFLMADEGRSVEQIDEVKKMIDDKLVVYHEHLKAEKDKKAAALDAEKKQEIERKKLEADLARKKKQTELAKKRAQEAAEKASLLTEETTKLEPIVTANKLEAEIKAKHRADLEAKTKAEAESDAAKQAEADPVLAEEEAEELLADADADGGVSEDA